MLQRSVHVCVVSEVGRAEMVGGMERVKRTRVVRGCEMCILILGRGKEEGCESWKVWKFEYKRGIEDILWITFWKVCK